MTSADFLAVVSYVWDHLDGEVVAVQKLAEKIAEK